MLLPHVHPHALAATQDRLPDLLPPSQTASLSYFIVLVLVTLNYLTPLRHQKAIMSTCLFLQPPCSYLIIRLEFCPSADT